METAFIIDIIFAAVLLIFTALGLHRGLFQSVIGLVVIVASLVGAGICANTFSDSAAEVIRPAIVSIVEKRVNNAADAAGVNLDTTTEEDSTAKEDTVSIMDFLGVYNKSADNLAESAVTAVKDTGKTIIDGVVDSFLASFAYAAVYVIAFIVLMAALTLLAKFVGLLTEAPGLHLMNALGGGVFGLVQGTLILMFITWLIRSGVIRVAADTAANSRMLEFFMTFNPISLISGI